MLLLSLLMATLANLPPLEEHGIQRLFRNAAPQKRITALFGGLQSGKTIAAADTLWQLLYVEKLGLGQNVTGFHPEVWFVSKSYTLVDAAWDTYRARHPETLIADRDCRKFG